MKLNKKLEINLFDFFKYGKFDYIKLGQTKEWILNNFPEPDSDWEGKIWTYGNIEFHFNNDILFLIFCENFDNLNAGENIIIDKWILKELDRLKLINVLEKLNTNNIDYKKTRDILGIKTEDVLGIRLILESGVEMTFENINNIEDLDQNNYELQTFGLMNMEIYKK